MEGRRPRVNRPVKQNAAHTGLRAGFEEITRGWGADRLDDLTARCQLLAEWWGHNFPLSHAEYRIAKAMRRRVCELGGIAMTELQ